MKLISYFEHFLSDTVNLNKARLDTLNASVESVYQALIADEELGPFLRGKIPQGSWAHRTIIKPLPDKEYDADFLLEFVEIPDWGADPKKYRNALSAALGRSGIYSKMPTQKKCRCVRLSYERDFHLDIVPYIVLSDGREVIVDCDNNVFEPTNPAGFTAWIADKDGTTSGNLRQIIRIMKFLRDHKGTFLGTRSIILTTLLGERVAASKSASDPTYYGDVPTTLLHVVSDLDQWLQDRPNRPSIADPSHSGATFDHRWSDETYTNLRERIHSYSQQFLSAYEEPDQAQSVEAWKMLFGAGFSKPPSRATASKFGATAAAIPSRSGRAG